MPRHPGRVFQDVPCNARNAKPGTVFNEKCPGTYPGFRCTRPLFQDNSEVLFHSEQLLEEFLPPGPWIPFSFFTFSQAAQAESLWDRGGGATVSTVLWEPGFPLWFQQQRRWQVDYRGDEVSVENFLRLLTGTARSVGEISAWFIWGSFGI